MRILCTLSIALSRPVLFPLEDGAIFLDFSRTDSSPNDGILMLNRNADVNEAESLLMRLITVGSGLQGGLTIGSGDVANLPFATAWPPIF